MRLPLNCARGALVVAGLAALVSPALAQNPDSRTAARALLQEGAQRYDQGDYEGALAKFKQAHQRFQSPKIFFNLGQALRGLSRNVEAIEAFERFLAEAKDASPAFQEQARSQVTELTGKLARIAVGCNRPRAVVTIDDAQKGTTPLEKPVFVEPGSHRLTIVWEGETKSVPFAAAAGQVVPLVIDFEERKPAPIPMAAPAKSEPQVLPSTETRQPNLDTRFSRRATWYWIAGGALVAGAATCLILVYGNRQHYPTADLGRQQIGGGP